MSKRKAYRPRPMVSPLMFLQPASQAWRDQTETRLLSALASLASGSAPSMADWKSIADVIALLETLVIDKPALMPADVIAVCEVAAEAMLEATRRFQDGKALRLSGIGINACRDVIDVYVQAAALLMPAELHKAECRTVERQEAAKRAAAKGVAA